MVYDVYHTIPLNVVKNQLTRLLELELVDTEYLDKQIRDFPCQLVLEVFHPLTLCSKENLLFACQGTLCPPIQVAVVWSVDF